MAALKAIPGLDVQDPMMADADFDELAAWVESALSEDPKLATWFKSYTGASSAQELDLAALHDVIREQWGTDLAFVEIDVEDDAAVNALRSLARERRLRVFDEGPGEDWDLGA